MTASPVSRDEARKFFEPLARFPRVALAVSGGPDSVALLHLAASWREERGPGPDIGVLTVDHRLRVGSRDEALLVGRLAAERSLPHAILAWDSQEEGDTALQARARAARYDLMAAHCHTHQIPALVTAHHLDDQAETFFMRLKRGSGLDGLAAIPEEGAWAGIVLLRPLLEVPKARLVATLAEAGIPFATDPSNADPRFERALLRASVEALAKLGLSPEAIVLSVRRLRRARLALDRAADAFLLKYGDMDEAGYASLDREALVSAPQEIGLRGLSKLIAAVGGSAEPVRLAKLEALLEALLANPDRAHTLGRCRIAPKGIVHKGSVSKGGRLFIFREVRATGLPALSLAPGERILWDNRFAIELGRAEPAPVTVKALGDWGVKELRMRSVLADSLPRLAGRTLPSCWRGDELLGIPVLGAARSTRSQIRLDCRAIFVGKP